MVHIYRNSVALLGLQIEQNKLRIELLSLRLSIMEQSEKFKKVAADLKAKLNS